MLDFIAWRRILESIQSAIRPMEQVEKEGAMHPVNFLFEDVYRNDWGIASATLSEKRRGKASPWKRELRFIVDRKRG
ncbi:hypothetical protein [Mesorhizobium sp. M4B.F.Ca.ET.089.01.1.1]|uniref:hypothetical protein n=1 Tax=Mesorhizobium sp. M4B.F.Ca.ET.089.01.1.1 TaxID=2496662 RepID=UPI00167B2F74|nr:hypothetical protein [Mesorhizobium sp. M4B.F.Ca.ET.089.01.1.1]